MLTQKILKELIDYNPDTGVFTWLERDEKLFKKARDCKAWNNKLAGKSAGSITKCYSGKSYLETRILGGRHFLHRLAFLYVNGSLPASEVDHIDGDGTNNKWCNLRSVSHQDNGKNVRLRVDNKSGVCGVILDKVNLKWQAYIIVDSKQIHLGRFKNLEDAKTAREDANKKYGFHSGHGTKRPL